MSAIRCSVGVITLFQKVVTGPSVQDTIVLALFKSPIRCAVSGRKGDAQCKDKDTVDIRGLGGENATRTLTHPVARSGSTLAVIISTSAADASASIRPNGAAI